MKKKILKIILRIVLIVILVAGIGLTYLVGAVGGVKIISLSNLCGRRSIVSFQYEHRLF